MSEPVEVSPQLLYRLTDAAKLHLHGYERAMKEIPEGSPAHDAVDSRRNQLQEVVDEAEELVEEEVLP